MTTLDELVVRIRADTSQLERELKRMSGVTQQQTDRMAGSFNGLKAAALGFASAFSAGFLIQFGKQAIAAAGQMNDLADRIGFTASTLSALETPLSATGTSLEQFAAAINLMNANLGQAVSGNEQMAEAFSRLGLSVDELKRLSPEDQFYAIARALGEVGTQYEQTELGRAIFGRGFASLIPLIKESNGNLAEHVGHLKEMNEGLSDETIDRIDAFGDAWAAAGVKTKNAFLEAFAAILQVNDLMTDTLGKAAPGSLNQARLGTSSQSAGLDAYMRKAAAGDGSGGRFVTEPSYWGAKPTARRHPARNSQPAGHRPPPLRLAPPT